MAEHPPSPGGREEELGSRIRRLDELLAKLEQAPGPTAAKALEALALLTGIYGEALERVMARVAGAGPLVESLVSDELLGHLFTLHGIHPAPTEKRVLRAVEEIRPYVESHGGEVELLGIEDAVARVRVIERCETCAPGTVTEVVTDAVLASAPELQRVEAEDGEPGPPDAAPDVITVESLLRHRAARA